MADDILDKQFINEKEQEDAELQQLKDEYNFDQIKDALDEETELEQR